MLIRDTAWSRIREQFSEEEKADLRKTVTGETICPRGFIIDATQLQSELNQKLSLALKGT